MADERKQFALVNGKVILPDSVSEGLAVVVDGSRIAGVTPVGELGVELPRVDVGGREHFSRVDRYPYPRRHRL